MSNTKILISVDSTGDTHIIAATRTDIEVYIVNWDDLRYFHENDIESFKESVIKNVLNIPEEITRKDFGEFIREYIHENQ